MNDLKKYLILNDCPGKCKKSGRSFCKSENPLYENIPSEKKPFSTPTY